LGRMPAALVTGGAFATIAWMFGLAWSVALAAGMVAFLFALFIDLFNGPMMTSGRRGGWTGGGWSGGGGSWSGGGGGGFSGGGGSFGGGGAS
ncbi:hypothetical protein NK918_24080, partial [Salmonella enterica subsp. enterica serovar Typhimurium]|uniref:hypothetical protein n=1 Tax=Salmonella enterica TaxID=28901 RepID=UPI0020A25B02